MVAWLIHWRRSGWEWFDCLELDLMHAFARLWHRCAPRPQAPLPAMGPLVLIANHPSHADPAFLLASSNRVLHFLHARECYEVPILRHLFARAGCIPASRHGSDVGGIREALRDLARGGAVALFPEGDVGLAAEGGVAPGKPGAALLALRSGAPVYPAWISGGPRSRSLLGAWLWPSRGVRVRFGPSIDLSAYRGQPITQKRLQEATALLMGRLAELSSPRSDVLFLRRDPVASGPIRDPLPRRAAG